MLTGMDTPWHIENELPQRGCRYLAKPYDFPVLLAKSKSLTLFQMMKGRKFYEKE